jgi:hypothetical protein
MRLGVLLSLGHDGLGMRQVFGGQEIDHSPLVFMQVKAVELHGALPSHCCTA